MLTTKLTNKLANHVLTLIYARLPLHMVLNVLGEPVSKLLMRVKQCRHDVMQQRPQLVKIKQRVLGLINTG